MLTEGKAMKRVAVLSLKRIAIELDHPEEDQDLRWR